MSVDACSLFRPCSHNSASLPSQKYGPYVKVTRLTTAGVSECKLCKLVRFNFTFIFWSFVVILSSLVATKAFRDWSTS